MNSSELLERVVGVARAAGDAIMDIYDSDDLEIEMKKEDDFESPLTIADKAANEIIERKLKETSGYPIISEENNTRRVEGEYFWLVDPLDGTKEFIKRNGEFTVNIALIKNEAPVLGVVYAPAKDVIYFAAHGNGAYKQAGGGNPQEIEAVYGGDVHKVVVSRSHRDEQIQAFLDELGEDYEEISMGSSLKLCLVAEGTASVYPRLAPTSLWDTAAADVIVREAGGSVQDTEGVDLRYDPNQILNPFFIVKTKNYDTVN